MSEKIDDASEGMLTLGSWLGRHQAFGLIANRCTAADAECLKTMKDSGEYRKLGLTWEGFCKQHAGVSRVYADRLIGHLDEFGANYFRLAELIQISGDTYRLIAAAVSEEGVAFNGECIPLARENRRRIMDAVQTMRSSRNDVPRKRPLARAVGKKLDSAIAEARAAACDSRQRGKVVAMLYRVQTQVEEVLSSLRPEVS